MGMFWVFYFGGVGDYGYIFVFSSSFFFDFGIYSFY